MKRRIVAIVLLIFCISLSHAPIIQATSYGTYDDLLLTTFAGHIVALWPLNELSGVTAHDISGNGRNGTYSGVTLDQIDGAGSSFGRAGLWDGINDYVEVYSSSLSSVFNVQLFTISCWVKSTDTSFRMVLNFRGSDEWFYITRERATYHNEAIMGSPSNNWFNIIYAHGSNHRELYYDNALQGTSDITISAGTLAYAKIGSRADNPSYFWNGYIQQCINLDYVASSADRIVLSNPNPPTPTPTPTSTPTPTFTPSPSASPTMTPTITPTRPIRVYATLVSNGQTFAIDNSITVGQAVNLVPGLLLVVFLAVALLIKLARRR